VFLMVELKVLPRSLTNAVQKRLLLLRHLGG
jgi:hypothetical protein